MKTHIKYFIAVSLMLAIGIVVAGTVTAAEQPIWHNFTNETTLTGTLPSEAHFNNTAQIWQAQIETFQKASSPKLADQQASPSALDMTKPIWCELTGCHDLYQGVAK
jgi:hypothetical protein